MKLLTCTAFVIVASLTLLLLCDPFEEYSRWRRRAISNEYRECIEKAVSEPSNERLLRHAITVYRQRSASNAWARAEFWGQFSHYLAPYKSTDKGSEVFRQLLLPELQAAINDDDELVRFEAISLAGRMGVMSGPVVPEIVSVMKRYPDLGSGLLAIRVLGEIGPAAESALPELKKIEQNSEDARESIRLIQKEGKNR